MRCADCGSDAYWSDSARHWFHNTSFRRLNTIARRIRDEDGKTYPGHTPPATPARAQKSKSRTRPVPVGPEEQMPEASILRLHRYRKPSVPYLSRLT